MFKKNAIFSFVSTTAMLLLPLTQAEAGTELGVLTCKKIPGSETNLLIHSSAGFNCVYKTAAGFEEKYKGEAGIALGLDLSWTKENSIAYTVMGAAEGTELTPGAFVGTYTGGTASASVQAPRCWWVAENPMLSSVPWPWRQARDSEPPQGSAISRWRKNKFSRKPAYIWTSPGLQGEKRNRNRRIQS